MALRGEELEFNLREWSRKGHFSRQNPSSRRFSTSYIQSSREDHKSSRTTFTISSTASSPRCSLTEDIDLSNYTFTSALKGYKKKTGDWLKPEGSIELNSKWNEAEKYISNPLSGEVPMECFSSKTLISRSFRDVSNKPTHNLNNPRTTNPNVRIIHEDPVSTDPILIQEKKVVGLKRDVGVQSAPVNVNAVKTPLMMERPIKRQAEADDSPVEFAFALKAQQEVEEEEKNMIMTTENQDDEKKEMREVKKKNKRGRSGLFSWMMRKRESQPTKSKCLFLICFPK